MLELLQKVRFSLRKIAKFYITFSEYLKTVNIYHLFHEKKRQTSITSVFMDFSLDLNSKNISMIQKITHICKDEISCPHSF